MLQALSRHLRKSKKADFVRLLSDWHNRLGDFIKERTVNADTGRWHYTHKRLRSAYLSLKNNLSYLFTHEDYPSLKLPKTTNLLDGSFAHLKELLLVHRGLKKSLKRKMIEEILAKQDPKIRIMPQFTNIRRGLNSERSILALLSTHRNNRLPSLFTFRSY